MAESFIGGHQLVRGSAPRSIPTKTEVLKKVFRQFLRRETYPQLPRFTATLLAREIEEFPNIYKWAIKQRGFERLWIEHLYSGSETLPADVLRSIINDHINGKSKLRLPKNTPIGIFLEILKFDSSFEWAQKQKGFETIFRQIVSQYKN